jgi:hypothetical protein
MRLQLYEHEGELGVFNLFLNTTWFKAMNQYCNESLSQKGSRKGVISTVYIDGFTPA